jgi:hypothetical protein
MRSRNYQCLLMQPAIMPWPDGAVSTFAVRRDAENKV